MPILNAPQHSFIIPQALKKFAKQETIFVRSPGRINLIGEHTDYNDGFVLPAAIDKAVCLSITPANDKQIHLHAIDLNDSYNIHIDNIVPSAEPHWSNYLLGVVAQFLKAGIVVNGFEAAFTSDIPIGAGLSSSAAVECAMAMALNIVSNAQIDKMQLVKMSQLAEHEFAGVHCGIMDQFASMFGQEGNLIKLDCRSLEYEYRPFNIQGYKIVLFDTNVKHSLASSEYNVRRKQCEAGVAIIQQHHPHAKNLRDATIEMLDKYLLPQDVLIYQRCKYVVEENARLLQGCDDLEKGDIQSFGKKMFATHHGLSKLYEVSCPELDFLVEQVENNSNVAGARMMGGGFGGCTINIVKEEAVNELIVDVEKEYKRLIGKTLKAYITTIKDGTTVLF